MATTKHEAEIVPAAIVSQFPPADRYLIGVSGGRDSIALLHALVRRGYQRLIVCHLDHQLRGRASAADARFVARVADALGLECETAKSDVREFAAAHRQSIETAARAVRYAFFLELARRRRCRTIFLAHHADDLVETYLFNLFRGGARTMRPVSIHSLGKTKLTIVRPLLHVWRDAIDAYISAYSLKFREDATNAGAAATRNRMRHKIIPYLEKEFGRGIRKAIWRTAVVAQEEDAILESMSAVPAERLDVRSLGKQPIALQRRAIRAWLQHHGVADVAFDLVESVRALLDPRATAAKVNLPRDRHARRRAGELFIE
ncbi:MAG TPA: tRNA lysidine(34) synthetase TilS [Chthoniobacterales bacterium]